MTARMRAAAVGRIPRAGSLLVAVLAGGGGVAGSFAVASFTPAFVAGPIAGFLARRLPAVVVTTAILVLGDLGDHLNVLGALTLATLLLAGTSLVGMIAGRRLDAPVAGPVAVVAGAVVSFAITRAPAASLAAGGAAGLVVTIADFTPASLPGAGVSDGRRRVLGGAASALAVAVGGFAVGASSGTRSGTTSASTGGRAEWTGPAVDALLSDAAEKSLGVAGLEPLVSEEFYEVDINATDPTVDADEWTLTVTGAVEEERTYTYDDLFDAEPEHRFVSLRCVGEGLNGKKLDNALWTGVPLADLVERAGPAENCCVMLRAADGFYEEFPLPALENAFLAYGMNGDVLPRGHGYPARALVPGHWGEINVKWLTEIEVLEREQEGYWEKRGWHGTGPVNTVAKLHAVNDLDDGTRQVAGHAYAGTRGVRAVEVSTDGGETWAAATLSDPLPGEDVWRQWTYSYEPPGVEHEVVVRAVDGNGDLQPREESSPFPSGPSGWVSRTMSN